MNLCYLNEELNSKIKTTIFTKNDIELFIRGFLSFLGISNELKCINYVIDRKGNLARYNYITHNLNIDYDALIDDANEGYGKDSDYELILFTNIMIILSLVHEITHIYQYAHKDDNSLPYNIMKREFGLFKILEDEEYNKYWGYFTCEREAVINSYEYVLFLLRTVIKNEEMYDYFFSNLVDSLISCYKVKSKEVISPLQVINKRFRNKSTQPINLNDIYESLKYGYPINREEYEYYKKNKEIIVTKKITCMTNKDMLL